MGFRSAEDPGQASPGCRSSCSKSSSVATRPLQTVHAAEPSRVLQARTVPNGSLGQKLLYKPLREFPSGPMAKTLCSRCSDLGSIPGQGTRSHMLQLRVHMPQPKILSAATKTLMQIKKYSCKKTQNLKKKKLSGSCSRS